MEEFPSNSFKNRERALVKQKTVNKVVTGQVKKKRKSLNERFAQAIFSTETENIISYIFYDILVPAFKDTIVNMFTSGIEMTFYGEDRKPNRIRRDGSRSYVSYNSFSRDERRPPFDRRDSKTTRLRQRFDDVVLDRRSDAEEVLDGMQDLIENYQVCTVADFYDLVGLPGEWSDNKYGWDNLSTAYIQKVREGYTLDLPKPLILN